MAERTFNNDLSEDRSASLMLMHADDETHWQAMQALTLLEQTGGLDVDGVRELVYALGLDALRPPADDEQRARPDLATIDVRCPQCEVPPGARCVTGRGTTCGFHVGRVRFAANERDRKAAA